MRSALALALLGTLAFGGAAGLIVWQTGAPERETSHTAGPAARPPSPEATSTGGAAVSAAPHDAAYPAASTSAPPNPADDREHAAAEEVRAEVRAGRIGKARSLAASYYERFPDGPATAEIGRLTGAHPTVDRASRGDSALAR